jgi:NAD(P)-dependent dehydrogenase (short-subunit alcohol dehydrogenase family)
VRALVTGGTGHVGSAIARSLEEAGHSVLAVGRADADLTRRNAAFSLVERSVTELGGLDLVVNAAAAGFQIKPIEDVTEDDWDLAWGATVRGSFFVSQAAAPHLRTSRGLIVMIEDVAGYLPWANLAPHCAAKAAQALLTRIFARALAPEVRVCGVAPGPVAVPEEHARGRADRTLLRRVGEPSDVAEAVLYLVGADYVTGTSIVVDGGRMLKTMPPEP